MENWDIDALVTVAIVCAIMTSVSLMVISIVLTAWYTSYDQNKKRESKKPVKIS